MLLYRVAIGYWDREIYLWYVKELYELLDNVYFNKNTIDMQNMVLLHVSFNKNECGNFGFVYGYIEIYKRESKPFS